MQDIIYEMFAHYADSTGIALDAAARSTVLYSAGWNGPMDTVSLGAVDNAGMPGAEDTKMNESQKSETISKEVPYTDDLNEIVSMPEGWQDPEEEIDVWGIAGKYEGLIESSSASLSIYSGATEEEIAAGEVGSASIDIGGGVLYEGTLISLENNEYAVKNDTGHEVILQVFFFRGLFFELYIDGEHVDTYHMVEAYMS